MSTTKYKKRDGAIAVKKDGKFAGTISAGKDAVPTAQNDASITNPNSPSALSKISSFLGQHKNKVLIAGAAGAFFMLGAIPALVVAGVGYWIIKRDFKDRANELDAENNFATSYDINENGEGEITDETVQNSQKLTKLSRKQKATIAVAGTGLFLIGGLPAIALGGACVWLGLRNRRNNNAKSNTNNFDSSDEHETQSLGGDMVDPSWQDSEGAIEEVHSTEETGYNPDTDEELEDPSTPEPAPEPEPEPEPVLVLTPTPVRRPKKRSVPDSVTNPNSIFNDGSHSTGDPVPAKPQPKPAKPVAPAKRITKKHASAPAERTTRKHTPAPAAFTEEQFESILQDSSV